jgi:predicted Zn-dependent protease
MRFDRYQPCPCGRGKKIKFCCSSDIVDDLARILRMSEGEQRAAALEVTQQLLAKYPDRPSLLALKGELEMQLDHLDAARQTVSRLTQLAPDSSVAYAQMAVLAAVDRQIHAAVSSLHRALELSQDELLAPIYEALGVVADLLLASGQTVAARGHYLLQAVIAGDDDPRPTAMLLQLDQSAQIPLLLKDEHLGNKCPEKASFGQQFQHAIDLYNQGNWMAAREAFRQIAAEAPGEPTVLKNIASLEGLLGDIPAAVAAHRRYAALESPALEDRVEAEAIAQLLDPTSDRRKIDRLKVTYAVNDAEKLLQKLVSDRRAARMPIDTRRMATADEPPPKAAFWLLDRPLAQTGVDLARDMVSNVVCDAFLFGKQTDRPARLELLLLRSDQFQTNLNTFLDVAGDALGAPQHEQVVSQISAVTEALSTQWHLPEDTPAARRDELMNDQLRHLVFDRWTNQPLDVLDEKTPAEVSADPNYRVRLLAAIVLLEAVAEQHGWDTIDFDELRAKLGLPIPAAIDPATADLEHIPLVRLTRVMIDKLNDEQLIVLFRRAGLKRARNAMRRLGTEIVGRESLKDREDRAEIYGVLARETNRPDQALALLEKAKEAARAARRSPARFLIAELDLQLRQGKGVEAKQILDTIQARHAKEPGVQESVLRLLASYGLVRPDGLPRARPRRTEAVPIEPAAVPQGPARQMGLWTPDGAAVQDREATDKSEKPTIWVPGMD